MWNYDDNKKVLLRERKRHTAHRVASARYATLSPDGGGGVPHPDLWRVYPSNKPDLEWGTPLQVWMDRHLWKHNLPSKFGCGR